METRLLAREQNPASLKVGTRVGPWRVVSWRGQGTYGTVYKAVRDGREEEGFFALKMANHARNERFEREGDLLSLIRHPNVPRLHGQGHWECALGVFPYLVMEWVEGVPLYDWSSQRNPTQRQVMELVAQVAGALAAVEAAGGVHRDVKGDNVLVRLADGRPFLTDFGSGMVRGAAVLTLDILPPNTVAYRSPEAWAYQRFNNFQARAHYEANASDDLFALGVTAYRLVTDEYPPPTQPDEAGAEVWRWNGKGPRSPRELNAQLGKALDGLILRLVSVNPEERFNGSPEEAAEAWEQVARETGPEADELLFAWETQAAAERSRKQDPVSQRLGHRPRRRDAEVVQRSKEGDAGARVEWERQEAREQKRAQAPTEQEGRRIPARRLVLSAAVVALMVFVVVPQQEDLPRQWEPPVVVQAVPGQQEEGRDGGTAGLGDGFSSVAAKEEIPPQESARFVAVDMPKNPLAGQLRAPCKSWQVEIRGGCWDLAGRAKPPCDDETYEWLGNCYIPIFRTQRRPASDEP
ncbi:serine/threonine-protein kinase [Hyalangium sp.]|uniref:serine/threonine protein kinase n=1 Tax=Hyalangium sp. TaxID=2028555 RepID=UPI002D45DE70|nr:serine/threonine-protein kinase [Hyalangium sp.]HYH98548.1 serine/threonine-protein kinase [Hyalangium sp.]